MNAIINEQLIALMLLIDFLFGIAFGVFGGVAHGARHGSVLSPAADDALSAGAWTFIGVYARDDDGYLHSLLPGNRRASANPDGDDGSESQGQGVDR